MFIHGLISRWIFPLLSFDATEIEFVFISLSAAQRQKLLADQLQLQKVTRL
jgi:hypothetical protein